MSRGAQPGLGVPAPAEVQPGRLVPLSGWGGTASSVAEVVKPRSQAEVAAAVRATGGRGVVARGLGRSYGDPAQNAGGRVVDMTGLDEMWLDPDSGRVDAQAGVSLDALLLRAIPRGFFVPVTPGTRFVTLGGCVAADVHGKNHHVDGSFGLHITAMDVLNGDGATTTLRPGPPDGPDRRFWATVGGMGHTGIILRVTVQMLPITTSRMLVDTDRFESLDSLMGHMTAHDNDYRYSVAWVDSVNGKSDFRSVLTCGDHAESGDLPGKQRRNPLAYNPGVRVTTPFPAPSRLLNRSTIAAFNSAWFHKAPDGARGELQSIASFFHPLDLVGHWNRIYGRRGFLQYQFAVPDSGAHLVSRALETLRRAGAPSFLTVLKRFGAGNAAPLSFPQPGWTLTVDVPADVPRLDRVLDDLDEQVVTAGGRHYLAKDSRMRGEIFRAGYPRWSEWLEVAREMDPNGTFTSDQFRRLLG
jgi:decaprenylphospho-beta-D-ribofuranose 2-oxidase